MISQAEFERIVESYLWELQSNSAVLTGEKVLSNPQIMDEINELKLAFQAEEISYARIVSFAFGLVDEITSEVWSVLMNDAYQLYLDRTDK